MNNIEIDWICINLKKVLKYINENLIDAIDFAKTKKGIAILIDRSTYGNQTELEKHIRELIPTINRIIGRVRNVNKID